MLGFVDMDTHNHFQGVPYLWVPLVKAVNQLNGFGLTLMYTNQTSGQHYDRTFQVYWDMQMTGNFA